MPLLPEPHRLSGPHSRSSTLQDPLASAHSSFVTRSRLIRELITLGGALLFGFVVVPLAIWFVGNRILGPYSHGTNPNAGPLALVGDFFAGLSHGWVSYWIVALGPVAIILFARLAWALIKFTPSARGPGERRRA
ncbi:MAG: hypothetical protein JO042_09985 [Sinobacteraceae bacterium]|nr:hypothetical protein [Nevskiaceae bacterium]